MKKNLFLSVVLMLFISSSVLADGMVFDPTVYSATPVQKTTAKTTTKTVEKVPDIEITEPSITKTTSTTLKTEIPSNKTMDIKIEENATAAQSTISNQTNNFNDALFNLDTAQVNIRNELLEYKAKYQEIDTQYKLIKEQRKVLGKQIKDIERRIKGIEKSKNNIRKTML